MRADGILKSVSLALLLLSIATLSARAEFRPGSSSLPSGFWRQASKLQPDRFKLSQIEALRQRKAPDELDVLVIGCDFSDSLMWGRDIDDFPGWPAQRRVGNRIPLTDIPEFAAHDAAFFDIQMQKVSDYFATVSFGAFTLNWDVHSTIVNLPESMGYYGRDETEDLRVVEMAQTVVDSIDAQVDFSAYDTIVLIHAGAGQETDVLSNSPEQIFSNYLDIRDFEEAVQDSVLAVPALTTDEGDLLHALILPESESQDSFPEAGFSGFFGTRGVYCFEFGLRLGMINLGDFTPPGFPDSQGIGNFGLMGFGLFTGLGIVPSAPSAFNRWLMGWVPAVEVRDDSSIRLGAMGEAGDAVSDTLLIKIPIDDRQYWLVEYRLQDPDGDLFFTFDDLNDNNVPDFFDVDSPSGGRPTASFDPSTDTWESTLGAEWDWFMSENSARSDDRCDRAGGSGLYIWHIDERVILDAITSGTTITNADAKHRGVDVEEADGIQDLDSRAPGPYFLGWDGDAWRGANAEFGPDTNPDTATTDGLPTGIRIHQISDPVIEQFPRDENGDCTGYIYDPTMTFQVNFGDAAGLAPAAQRSFVAPAPFGDVRLVDLGTSPGSSTPDGAFEIVLAADGGEVLAFDGTLTEWLDGDADPGTIGILARGTGAAWIGPPAIGDVDGDGIMDVVLAASDALHAFSSADGDELLDGDADGGTTGPLWAPTAGRLVGPPMLVGTAADVDATPHRIVQLVEDAGQTTAYRLTVSGGTVGIEASPPLDAVALTSGPSLAANEAGDGSVLYAWTAGEEAGFTQIDLSTWDAQLVVNLDAAPLASPLLAFAFAPGSPSQVAYLDSLGAATSLDLDTGGSRQSVEFAGPWTSVIGGQSASSPVLAFGAGERLVALDRNLAVKDGFPYRPVFTGETLRTGTAQSAPLLVDLTGSGVPELLWHDPVGRVHAVRMGGSSLSDWPLPGPSEPNGSMAVGDVDGDGTLELVVLGRFEAIESAEPTQQTAITRAQADLRVYPLSIPDSAVAPWTQGRGGPLQRSAQPADLRGSGIAPSGSRLVEDSLWVSPNPARGTELRVRVAVRQSTPIRATLYNLEGEEVATSGEVFVDGGASLDQTLAIDHLVTGYYLCRVEAGDEVALLAFTVVK